MQGLQMPPLLLLLQITDLHFKDLTETLPAILVPPTKGNGSHGKKFRHSKREGRHYDAEFLEGRSLEHHVCKNSKSKVNQEIILPKMNNDKYRLSRDL